MVENTSNAPDESDPRDKTAARRNLHNVVVLALVDGKLSEEEKSHIESLRDALGIDRAEFARLCQEVSEGDRRVLLPKSADEAVEALALLVDLAAVDTKVTPAERRALQRIAACVGVRRGKLDEMIAERCGPPDVSDIKLAIITEEIYRGFAQWDDAARRKQLTALGDLGPCAVKTLVRILESYRKPDGMPDALAMKVLVAEQLGRLGDTRPVYYLAQLVNLGDSDDEISNFELRAAAAEAIGKLLGSDFSRDTDGIAAVRQWWQDAGRTEYDYLVY
ncbi:MAG TPA: hypothetical protein VM031_03240 [Phycisphaerae bacterium]|nr:hypothetical protein [Phycisphaerae bacterium]